MKTVLMITSSLALALVMFVSGTIAATMFFSAEPDRHLSLTADTTALWTNEPVRVNTSAQEFERLPAVPVPLATLQNTDIVEPGQRAVSPAEDTGQPVASPETTAGHMEWCSSRFRSYRSIDNTYAPYSGGRRICISPYNGAVDAAIGIPFPPANTDVKASRNQASGLVQYVSAEAPGYRDEDHIQSCISRYRSYRPEDNSYQPYSGGPRRQCL